MHRNRWLAIAAASAAAGLLAVALLVPLTRVAAQAPFAPPPPVPGSPMPPPGPGLPGRPMPGMMRFPPPAQLMSATATHVYVLRGNTLFQFSAKDLKLLNKAALEVERPRPARADGNAPAPQP